LTSTYIVGNHGMMISNLAIAVGTYDGVVAGWELKQNKSTSKSLSPSVSLKLEFATSVHSGSVRSLSLTTAPTSQSAGSLLSSGYDESLRTHDWHKRMTSSGEVRTPSDFGTPVCTSYAPPKQKSTHCIVGFSGGKVAIYKKRDWSVQHVLAGHDGGVGAMAVHPTGKLALTGGMSDGKVKLWDLTKGRLAFVIKTNPASTRGGRTKYDPVSSIVWSQDGNFYALAYGPHITVREVASGKDLLDVDLPSRANQVCLMSGPDGLFVVAACDDGSLPVLAVEDNNDENRRAIMAIEPVDALVAREERFKCIAHADGYHVVTANSAGVISVMDLSGAVRMMLEPQADDDGGDDDENDNGGDNNASVDDDDDDDDDEGEQELAVDIIDSVQLGTGARITALAIWNGESDGGDNNESDQEEAEQEEDTKKKRIPEEETERQDERPSKRQKDQNGEIMDASEVEKARQLVSQAKKLKKKKDKKKKRKSAGSNKSQ